MKMILASCLMLGAFMLVLTGMPLQLLHIDLVKSAYAYINNGQNPDWDIIRGKDGDDGDRNENRGHSNDGEHGDSYNIPDNGNYFLRIFGKDDKWDDRGGEDNPKNDWGQFGYWKKFWVKDDDCKDFQGHDKDWHKNWCKNEDGNNYWCKHKHHEGDDGNCNKKVPEPAALSLFGAGIAGVGIYRIYKTKKP